jgi:hypothetical protein
MLEFIYNFPSLTLNNTSNLIALLVLLIPIIIHIINPNKATLIWIASIQLIKANDYKRIFQIKWLKKVLLMIRLTMFLFITLILTRPIFITEIGVINEEHHYFSYDWLMNISEVEQEELINRKKMTDKYFILENSNGRHYSEFKQLLLSLENNNKQLSTNSNHQESYISELEHRSTNPKMTHIYLTNRTEDYRNNKVSFLTKRAKNIHVKSLKKIMTKDSFVIEIITNPENDYEKNILTLALNTLSANSNMSIKLKHIIYEQEFTEFNIDTGLIFIVGDIALENKSRNVIFVNQKSNALIFSDSHGNKNKWSFSNPIELIELLSQIINKQEHVLNAEFISGSIIEAELQSDNLETKDKKLLPFISKSANRYLMFFFCLLLLIERLIVLRKVKHNE